MIIFRTVIHGHVIELRRTDFSSEEVLVNGRTASHRPWWSILPSSHHFDLPDESGRTRHVEVSARDLSLGKLRMFVLVDGAERARVPPLDARKPPELCVNCGYALSDLPAENSEIRCPECGRHTPEKLVRG